MRNTLVFIEETLGIQPTVTPIAKSQSDKFPLYILETFQLYRTNLFDTETILAELKNEDELSIQQTEKQVNYIRTSLKHKVVIVLENVQAYHRKRLIEKGVNFIVPGKQLYMPDLLIDLRESFNHSNMKQKKETLLPSAQFLLIHHLLHRNRDWKVEDHPFKEIAIQFGYTPMAISKAIDNLKYHHLINVVGQKEKFIRFQSERLQLWKIAIQKSLLINPVVKTVYFDEKPHDLHLLLSNTSALPEYTNLNPGKQEYYAIEKTVFYDLQKSNALVNLNEYEGRFALEVWKYNPLTLVDEFSNDKAVVDPLSLYMSLKDSRDERIEMALEQILQKFIW